MTIAITLYGKTYWDVEISVDLASLSAGKGKVDVPLVMTVGGFPNNAARALESYDFAGGVSVVTVSATCDQARLRRSLPERTLLCALAPADSEAMPAISVILNPERDCRILRDPGPASDPAWRTESVSPQARSAKLHILGRVPAGFAAGIIERVHHQGGRIAWCGGDTLTPDLEAQCDFVCVNSAEANRMLGSQTTLSPKDSAIDLARRARNPGAVRLVTGRGAMPAAAALVRDGEIVTLESAPAPVAREDIVGLLGVGDAFAATFLTAACFEKNGEARPTPNIRAGLDEAQAAATHFITHPRPRGATT